MWSKAANNSVTFDIDMLTYDIFIVFPVGIGINGIFLLINKNYINWKYLLSIQLCSKHCTL